MPTKSKITPLLKRKCRPRGRPFKPGNRAGASTQFRPGQSGNPGGRPSCKLVSEALRWMIATPLSEPIVARTRAERMAQILVNEGVLHRKLSAIAETIDRTEGRPGIAIRIDSEDPLSQLVQQMVLQGEGLGPPPQDDQTIEQADQQVN